MHRVLVGLCEELHRLHGLFGTPELVVRTGLLVDHPVVVLVVRVLGEQAVVERDGFERPGGRRLAGRAGRHRRDGIPRGRRDCVDLRCACLEIPVRLGVARHTRRGRRRRRRDCRVGLFRRRHFLDLAVPADAELLLDLQVRESPHCFRRHLGPRRFLEVPPVALHGRLEALLDLHFLDVGLDVVKLRERVARGLVRAGGQQRRAEDACQTECTHHCCPPPGCTPAGCVSPGCTLPVWAPSGRTSACSRAARS